MIQGLRSEIARQEAKLKDAGGNLGRNHPQYRSMESELAELKARLEAETRHVASVPCVATMLAICAVKRSDLRTTASREVSSASGS